MSCFLSFFLSLLFGCSRRPCGPSDYLLSCPFPSPCGLPFSLSLHLFPDACSNKFFGALVVLGVSLKFYFHGFFFFSKYFLEAGLNSFLLADLLIYCWSNPSLIGSDDSPKPPESGAREFFSEFGQGTWISLLVRWPLLFFRLFLLLYFPSCIQWSVS